MEEEIVIIEAGSPKELQNEFRDFEVTNIEQKIDSVSYAVYINPETGKLVYSLCVLIKE